ncbi:LacI family DNA-binding transcriptional regulator [Saccharibacillus sp. CPCC 101409]|uniref:LacI family DNA-binding transcriptional regulator n=1 Tax=Saccharibacillus sp. CPCC 101409 TaxID=3058041 RepID=UPI0026720451|nr:LacI family DNA-binding transcriptional regulator [Saccharibacillus sp. CPCC 101409]MDO3411534.1 LacI family DNA-binding transcriptional regulator [Saccharibacillus sp. CPCC 101409]
MTDKHQISIKEIANLSGVSVATVSRVINDNGRFSEETRRKVLRVIDEHGYSTNTVAKALRMNKSKTIGIIVPDIGNEFFSTIVHEIESYFFERGFSTFICNTDKSSTKESAYIRSLDAKMVDGLICISGREEIEASLLTRRIPIVCIDRRPRMTNNLAMIESDHFHGGYLAGSHLIAKGCRRPVILTKPKTLSSVYDRLEGFKRALAEHRIPFDEETVLLTDESRRHNIEKAREAIRLAQSEGRTFDGVFATNDWLAIGVVKELVESGVRVPEQVKVVGFDDDTIARYSDIPLTTIKQDVYRIAEEASQIFLALLTGKKKPSVNHHIKVPVELIERKTT